MHERSSGEALRGVLGSGPSRSTLLAQRPRVIAAMRAAALAEQRRPFVWGGLACAATMLALATGLAWPGREPSAPPVREGRAFVEPRLDPGGSLEGQLLRFAGGSEVRIARESDARLSRVEPQHVEIALQSGSLHAQLGASDSRSWAVVAGPYRVQATSAELSVAWSATTGEIEVSVVAGRALVFGFELPPSGLAVGAGARFARHGLPPLPAPSVAREEVPAARRSTPPRSEQAVKPPVGAKPVAGQAESDAQDWKALASSQRYADAFAAARVAGIDQLQTNLGAVDLLLLANTARYAGELGEARAMLHALRSRFPGSASATLGALVLAGMEERAKHANEAARWLRTYLAESPNGDLAAGARARLLGILVRTGQRSEARRVAADYLRLHPSGPYAKDARGVLDSSGGP